MNTVISGKAERNFYTAMAVAMLLVVIVGFARTFFLSPIYPEAQEFAAPETVFYVHGVIYTAWLLFLIGQALFVRSGNIRTHKRMGTYGGALAVAMVVLGIYAALVGAARPGGFMGVPIAPQQFLVVPFFDIVMFGLFVAWAIARRGDPQSHKRLMLFATINILEAAFARYPVEIIQNYFPFSNFLASDLFILAIIVWDLVSMKKLHRVTIIATVLTLVIQVARFMIMGTDAWLGFADWMTGFVS
jgi:uncharacterized membrane protein YozB (DUF420 family)